MRPEKTGRRCVLILLILLAAVFFLSFLLGRYRVSAVQTARLLADRALSGISRGRLRLAPTWTPEEASVVIQIRLLRSSARRSRLRVRRIRPCSAIPWFRRIFLAHRQVRALVLRWQFCLAQATL